jgi:hypothetical protein
MSPSGRAAESPKIVTLDFDNLSIGEQLTDQFRSVGVVFSGTFEPTFGTAGVVATQGIAGTIFFGNSEPNFIIVGLGSVTATFVEPGTSNPAATRWVRFRAGDGEPASDIVGVNAFDPAGRSVFSELVYLTDEGTTIEIGPQQIGQARIAKVRIFGLRPAEGSGVNMDDFSFSLDPFPE